MKKFLFFRGLMQIAFLFLFLICCSCLSAEMCETRSTPTQLIFRHLEPKGIGFSDGYTTGEFFATPSEEKGNGFFPFLDLRGHIFNSGRFAANGGIGARYWKENRIWGADLYYDFRKGERKHFHQIALGLESMGTLFDFFANGYLVVGRNKSPVYDLTFNSFVGHNLIASYKREVAMSGADATFRIHCLQIPKWDLYFDIGPYYYHPPVGKSLFGGKASLAAKLANLGFVEGSVSYDRVFKWIGQGIAGIQLPLGKKVKIDIYKNRSGVGDLLADRIIQVPDHNEIIVLHKAKKKFVAIDPGTGSPYSFIFVNNTHPHSDGSFEDPFGLLSEAQAASKPYDIIYVFQGDGTTNGMANGITLQNNQQLFGSGIAQILPIRQGNITIPPFSSGFPILTNTGGTGYAVTLANSNTVSGISIDQPQNEAIVGFGISNAVIQNNIITNQGAGTTNTGIDIEGPGMNGNFVIQNNIITDTNGIDGIYLSPFMTDVSTLNVIGNQVTVFGNAVEIVTNDNATTYANVLGNQLTSTKHDKALFLEPKNSSLLTYLIHGNTCSCTMTGSNNAGLLIQGHDTSYSSGVVSNNQFINSENGFEFTSGSNANFFMYADIINNTFTNNSSNDFLAQISASKGGTLCFGLENNRATSTGPAFNYNFNLNNPSAVMNLTYDINNMGTIGSSGTSMYSTDPTCP